MFVDEDGEPRWIHGSASGFFFGSNRGAVGWWIVMGGMSMAKETYGRVELHQNDQHILTLLPR